jgi:ribose transport system substrate-binding protein
MVVTYKKLGGLTASLAFLLAGSALSPGRAADAPKTGPFKIAFSNATIGNSWHQGYIHSIETAVDEAKKAGLIAKYASANANGDSSVQASQIRAFVVQGYQAIIVDATSASALNGAIAQACAHGVVVVGVDQTVTAPCAYNVYETFEAATKEQAETFAKALGGKGNVLEVRGTAGTLPDQQMHNGMEQGLQSSPDMKVVGTTYADWTDTVAQQKVAAMLPSLPKVDAVVGQGGDGAGSARAFQAAGRPMPMIGFGNRGNELRIWSDELRKNPNYVAVSTMSMPGIGSAGVWTAIAILQGQKLPKQIRFPLLAVTKDTLDVWVQHTPPDGVASTDLTQAQGEALLKSNLAGTVPESVKATPGGFKF